MQNFTQPTHAELKELFDEIYSVDGDRDDFAEENMTRMRRALSWLKRSEETPSGEWGERFLFLWIAFNSAYGYDPLSMKIDESVAIEKFLIKIKLWDKEQGNFLLSQAIKSNIRDFHDIIENPFMYKPFWEWLREQTPHNGRFHAAMWKKFDNDVRVKFLAENQYTKNNTGEKFLPAIFERLYLLRNQIIHGGATYHSGEYSSKSLSSVAPAQKILSTLVPVMLKILLIKLSNNPDMKDLGKIAYLSFRKDVYEEAWHG